MDQQLAEWQRQAQEAIQQQPEKKDAIMAMYNDDIRKYLEDQKRMAQKAIDEQGKPDYVISQFKQMLEDNKDVISFDKDLDYSKMFDVRPMQFRDTRSGVSSTADLPYEQGKFDGETPEEYYDRLERDSGGGHGAFSPFRLEEEEKAAAAQEEARRKARESLSFTGKLAADAEGFGKSLLSGGFRAGSAAAGIAGGVTEALGSTMNPVGSALGYNPLQEGADFLFKKSQEGKQASQMLQESIPMEASNTSRVLGQIVPQMAGGFAVEPFAQGADVLDNGGSLAEAELMSAKQGAINVAGLASGMLGSQARGILPLLSRGAAQVPTNIALGAVDRKLSGQEYTNEDMAMDAAFGAFGSIFRNADTPRVSDVLEDGPPAKAGEIDFSGDKGRIGESAEFSIPIQAIDRNKGMAPVDFTEQALRKYPQTVDAKEPPVFGEIVPTKTVIEDTGTASGGEVDRISLMERAANALPSTEAKALAKENIANSKEARTLQKELDQLPTEQELYSKLSGEYFVEDVRVHGPEGANDPRLTKLRNDSALEEAKRQRENLRKPIADELADVSDRLQRTEQLSARAADGQAALDQLRRVERQEQAGRVPSLPNRIPQRSTTEASFPSQGEGVTVSVTPAKAARAPSAVSSVSPTTKFNYTIGKDGTLTQAASGKSRGRGKATEITKEPGTPAPQSIAQLEQRLTANNQPPLLSSLGEGKEVHVVGAPRHLLDKLDKGTLTVDDVLTEGQKAVDSDPRGKKEGAHLIKYLSRLADSIGGRGVKFAVLDNNNPKHLEALQASEDIKNGRFSAFYHPQTNTIYLKPSTRGFNTMVHEATHGIVSKMLDMGKNGELKPAAQEAYNNLNTMFEAIKPELESRLAGLPEGSDLREAKGYGLTDVHEMYSEFFASKVFRDFLREFKVEKTWVDSLPENIRGVFVHAKNMYEVLKKGLSRFLASTGIRSHLDLGAGAKAENAYDYLLSSMEELHNSLEAGQSRMLRELSERNTDKAAPDLSFLGESAEPRQALRAPAVEGYHGSSVKLDSIEPRDIGFHIGTLEQASGKGNFLHRVEIDDDANIINLEEPVNGAWHDPYRVKQVLDGAGIKLPQHLENYIDSFRRSGEPVLANPDKYSKQADILAKIRRHLKSSGIDAIHYKNLYEGNKNASSYVIINKDKTRLIKESDRPPLLAPASALDEASRTTRWDSRNATRSSIDPSLDVQGEQRALRPQRSRLTASLKSGIAGRGLEPILTNARETLSGDKQEARLRQVTLVNKSIGALEGMGEATKSRVFELLGELESNSASPKSREQFAELKTLSPEIAATAKELLNDRFTNSGVLSNLLLESMKKSGKFDQKTANIALKIMENSNSWKPSVYDSKEATLRRRKSALRAEKKQQEKKLLSDEEKDDLAKWQNLNTWIRNTTYGNAEQLKKLSTDDLRAIYEANIKDAPSLKGLDKDAQRDLMIGYISDYNSKIVDIDQAVRNLADSIAGFGGSRDPLIKYFNGLKYDSGVLATKEQVPQVIREFWGEITNPLLRLIEGHTKQLLQISQVKALNSLREAGLGTLFTDRVDTHMNTRMQGSNYGALEGLYTTPEIHQAMGDIMDFGRQATGVMDSLISGRDLTNTSLAGTEKVLWAWVNATRAVKTSTTVLNAGAWWRNLEGSALQVVSNGNINPASYAKGMEAMAGLVGITQKSSVNPLSAKMIKLGLGEASQIADTYSAKNTRALDVLKTILDEHPEASPGKVRKLLDAGGHGKDVVKELYGALDLWTKFANFFNDLEQVREFNKRNDIEMSEQQLERYVADRTKQTNITYSRSPKVLKVLESLGNTQFANYYYEVFRTSLNNIGLGIQDMLKGIKQGDAAYTAHGLKRLVGTATAITAGTAMYTAITKATMAALGLAATEEADKKEIEEYRKESGFQDPTTSLEFKDPSTGGIFSFDAASINPYDPMAKVVLPALRAIADPANADEYGAEIAKNMGNLINRTPLIGGVTKALSGKSPSLKNTSPAAYDALVDMGVNGLGISVDTMDRVINATNALLPKQIKEVARAVSTEGSLSTKLAIGSGAGVYEVSPQKDVTNFLGPAFQAQLREAKEDYKDLMTSRIPVTKGALDKRFLQAIKDIAKPYASLDKAVKAQVALGRSKEDIILAMMGKNIEKSVAQMLYEGKATPALIVYDDMLDTAKTEIEQLDNRPKEQQAAKDRWQKKLSAIKEIATKYSKYSFEEIEEL